MSGNPTGREFKLSDLTAHCLYNLEVDYIGSFASLTYCHALVDVRLFLSAPATCLYQLPPGWSLVGIGRTLMKSYYSECLRIHPTRTFWHSLVTFVALLSARTLGGRFRFNAYSYILLKPVVWFLNPFPFSSFCVSTIHLIDYSFSSLIGIPVFVALFWCWVSQHLSSYTAGSITKWKSDLIHF